jgi:hypothetical protein
MAGHNEQNGRYRRRFVNWADRPSNAASARFADGTAERVRELNKWLDEHQAQGVVAEATGLCAAEARRRAARAAGWRQGEPGE